MMLTQKGYQWISKFLVKKRQIWRFETFQWICNFCVVTTIPTQQPAYFLVDLQVFSGFASFSQKNDKLVNFPPVAIEFHTNSYVFNASCSIVFQPSCFHTIQATSRAHFSQPQLLQLLYCIANNQLLLDGQMIQCIMQKLLCLLHHPSLPQPIIIAKCTAHKKSKR